MIKTRGDTMTDMTIDLYNKVVNSFGKINRYDNYSVFSDFFEIASLMSVIVSPLIFNIPKLYSFFLSDNTVSALPTGHAHYPTVIIPHLEFRLITTDDTRFNFLHRLTPYTRPTHRA